MLSAKLRCAVAAGGTFTTFEAEDGWWCAENRISHLLHKDPQVAGEGQTENIGGSKVNCQASYKLVRTKG